MWLVSFSFANFQVMREGVSLVSVKGVLVILQVPYYIEVGVRVPEVPMPRLKEVCVWGAFGAVNMWVRLQVK